MDIIAVNQKTAKLLHIEAKGGTSSRAGSNRHGREFDGKQVLNRVSKAFFTAVAVIAKKDGTSTGMAFPDSRIYRKFVAEIQPAISDLEIRLFWVLPDGSVSEP